MDSPIRQYQKQKDYQRHKLFRKIKRRKRAQAQQEAEAPIREMRRRVLRRFKDGKDKGISDQQYYSIMERVAENNNNEWNRLRTEDGGRPLSVDEEYLRILNDNSYNYRGYYNKYPSGSGNALDHWTDEFKTVWHPSFSTQSKYSGKVSQYNPYGILGGQWNGDNYVPAWGQKLNPEPKQRGWFEYNKGKNIKRFDDGEDIVYESPDVPINISYVPKSNVRVNPETGGVLTRDNQEGALMLPEVEIRPKRRLEQVYKSDLDLSNPISKKIQNFSRRHYWDPILGAPARLQASIDNGTNPLLALKSAFGIPSSSDELLAGGNFIPRVSSVRAETQRLQEMEQQVQDLKQQIKELTPQPTSDLTPRHIKKWYYTPRTKTLSIPNAELDQRLNIVRELDGNSYASDEYISNILMKNGVAPTKNNIHAFNPYFKQAFSSKIDPPKLNQGEVMTPYHYHPYRIEGLSDDFLFQNLTTQNFWNGINQAPEGTLIDDLVKTRPELYQRFVQSGEFPEIGRTTPFFTNIWDVDRFLRKNENVTMNDVFPNIENLYDQLYSSRYNVKKLEENGLTKDHIRAMINSGKVQKRRVNTDGEPLYLYPGSVRSALYKYDNPREALSAAAKDYDELIPGQSWALTDNGSLSHDSYTLLLSLMRKHSKDGAVQPVFTRDGKIKMQRLNNMGERRVSLEKLNEAISKVNKDLNLNLPQAVYQNGVYSVPSVIFTKYNSGKDSGIHINPKNRGKFNALKKRTGKTTEQLTHSKNPLTRKRAQFALNSRKWHHK